MRNRSILPFALLSFLSASLLYAQYYGGGAGGGGYYNWGGASTAAGSYAQGMASLVSAAGQANLYDSMAAGNYEDARSKDLDNRLKLTQKYFEIRQANAAGRAAEAGRPLSTEQLFRIAHQAAPKPLISTELDPLSGEIRWPIILRDTAYAKYRSTVDEVFRLRSANPSEFTAESYLKLQDATDRWIADLSSRINEYKSQDFVDAKKFIESLAFEARRV